MAKLKHLRIRCMDNDDGTTTLMVVGPTGLDKALIPILEGLDALLDAQAARPTRLPAPALEADTPDIVKLKHWRQEQGLTQGHVAKGLGVSQARYSAMEQGVRPISPEQWEKLSEILNVPSFILKS